MNLNPALPMHTQASAAIQRETRFSGSILIERLPRLAESLAGGAAQQDSRLAVELQAGRTGASTPAFLRGWVRGSIPLVCQRCLLEFIWPLDVPVDLRLVESEAEEARWLQQYEPYLIVDDRLPLHDLVEDEVLLALPLSPRCTKCGSSVIESA